MDNGHQQPTYMHTASCELATIRTRQQWPSTVTVQNGQSTDIPHKEPTNKTTY